MQLLTIVFRGKAKGDQHPTTPDPAATRPSTSEIVQEDPAAAL